MNRSSADAQLQAYPGSITVPCKDKMSYAIIIMIIILYVDFLNDEISRIETFKAIDYLINGKATGHDGILEEMLKISKYVPIPHLLILFNIILEGVMYPNR